MPNSTVHCTVLYSTNKDFSYSMFTVFSKQENLYDLALMKFVQTKHFVSWTVIYFILNLSPKCDYTSINTKKIFFPNLAHFILISGYMKLSDRNLIFVGRM